MQEGVWVQEGVWGAGGRGQEGVWRGFGGRELFRLPALPPQGWELVCSASHLKGKDPQTCQSPLTGRRGTPGSAASVQIEVRCWTRHHPKGCSPHTSHSADAAHLAFQTPAQKGRICASNN